MRLDSKSGLLSLRRLLQALPVVLVSSALAVGARRETLPAPADQLFASAAARGVAQRVLAVRKSLLPGFLVLLSRAPRTSSSKGEKRVVFNSIQGGVAGAERS